MFTGEGYSASQLAFYNAPSSSTFEPSVQKYWGSYIAGAQNQTAKGQMTSMDIWMNTFPLNFNSAVQVKASSFTTKAVASSLSAAELNTRSLTRDVSSKFNIYQLSAYTPAQGSVSAFNSTGIPGKESKGQIITQGIVSLFNI
jgi:hypothetical protein